MEEDQPNAAETPATSAPLITIRGLCILTALVGVILASSASRLRELNSSQLSLIAVNVGIVAISFGIFVVVYGVRRRRLEKEAGPLLMALDKDWKRLLHSWNHGGLLLFGCLIILLGVPPFIEDLQALSAATSITLLRWPSTLYNFGAGTFFLCISLWDFDLLQLRQNGVILGLTYAPWDKLKTCRWSAIQENTLLIGWGKMYQFTVAPEDRTRLERILAEISAQKNQP